MRCGVAGGLGSSAVRIIKQDGDGGEHVGDGVLAHQGRAGAQAPGRQPALAEEAGAAQGLPAGLCGRPGAPAQAAPTQAARRDRGHHAPLRRQVRAHLADPCAPPPLSQQPPRPRRPQRPRPRTRRVPAAAAGNRSHPPRRPPTAHAAARGGDARPRPHQGADHGELQALHEGGAARELGGRQAAAAHHQLTLITTSEATVSHPVHHYNMEAAFSLAEIVEVLRRTKKTDPLFRPLKKLKTAVEGMGEQALSFTPTATIAAFHFGLGNELDRTLLALTDPQELAAKLTVIPGHSYTVLRFVSPQAADRFMSSHRSIAGRPLAYAEVQYQNLSRTLVFLYCREDFSREAGTGNLTNCCSAYLEPIPGLFVYSQAVGMEEEGVLLRGVDGGQWERLSNRRVQHFGFRFQYGSNLVNTEEQGGELPEFVQGLLRSLAELPALRGAVFDQLTVNDYFAGDGIPSHFDTHSPFQEVFISVSLLSGLVMEFRRFDGQERSVYLPPRSVAVFSGEARFAWSHGISCRKVDLVDHELRHRSRRLSLTFRKVRRQPCRCPYYFYCDSQGYDQATMRKHNPLLTKYLAQEHALQLAALTPPQIEREFVHKAYNGFGFDFHNKPIPQILHYMSHFAEHDAILDLGCGNGQYAKHVPPSTFYVPVEKCRSMALAGLADAIHMDCLRLAFRPAFFDQVLLVAVLHHFACEQTRLQALREAARVMAPSAALYVTVLNYDTKRDIYSSPETLLEYCLPAAKAHNKEGNEKAEKQDMQVGRLEARGEVFQRYYHLFTEKELLQLLVQAGLRAVEVVSEGENIIVKAVKEAIDVK